MQEFQVDGNLMIQNVLLHCSKLSYCPVIIFTVKKHGCLTDSLDCLRTRPALKVTHQVRSHLSTKEEYDHRGSRRQSMKNPIFVS